LNKKGNLDMQTEKTLHIKLCSTDVGRYAIVPGNPDRCEKIAAFLDNPRKIMQNREHTTYEGFLEGERIIVTSTGMGGPSTAICVEELVKCGVDTFIRVGTAASTSPQVKMGDVVVVNGTVRMEGTGCHYLPMEFPAVPDYEILKALENAALSSEYDMHVGISITKDSYFTEINPKDKPIGYELVNRWNSYVKGGAITTSMEEATLFLVANSLKVRAGSVLVSATNYQDETSLDTSAGGYPADTEIRPIRVAIEALREIIAADKIAK